MPILTLLTDFGLSDYYVAAVKGVVLSRAPAATLVDVSHDVAPGDVEAASFLLAAAAPTFPPGTVHLAVVDPGVGSGRRILVAELREARFVAPDNGLLTPFLEGAKLRSVERPDLFLPAPGSTFHGRDRFAPVAAALLTGSEPADLGPAIDDPERLESPRPRRNDRELRGRIAHVDRFGNLVTDLPTRWLDGPFEARIGERTARRRAACYAEISAGEAAVLPGSLGTLELALRGESLADRWRVCRGDAVRIRLVKPLDERHAGSS